MLRDVFTSEKGSEGSSSTSRGGNPLSGTINSTFNNIRQQEDFYSNYQQQGGSSSGVGSSSSHEQQPFSPFQLSSSSHLNSRNNNMSAVDRIKMRERSERITRHLYPDSQATDMINEQNLNSRFGGMSLGAGQNNLLNSNNMMNMSMEESENSNLFLQNHSIDSYINSLQQQLTTIGNHINAGSIELHPPYTFLTSHTTNPYLQHQDHQYQNLYELARKFLSEQNQQQTSNTTNTEQAILALEAQVILEPHHADAWYLLGQCHAECDDDARAISCYAEAVKQDPNHLDALVDLGVSNANELQKHLSLFYLKRWISSHPIYASIVGDVFKDTDIGDHLSATMVDFYQIYSTVRQAFEKVVEESPSKDAKLHTALGVLYHLVNDFDKAINQFKMACQSDPTNHSLWNKRVAHSNRADYENAAKFYLRSLKLCPRNNSVWLYLSFDFSCLKRKDLVEKCEYRNVDLFKSDFQF
ncbi:TPR repeat protein [Naegleria gruberi]|uniref:TPR repeat protein n=1 Tax=Naegleria gruberi TaxID=5762 RepID=D2V581_NAEGR|nr:Peroxin 5 (Pex5), putative [Naegleria gruberi]EFC48063.1 TPR repeat protein [Naegleria gruberi]|eukprot:XP_002680807.1 TPR repeat protein [Naegleria gruberi strain NEG-M]